MPTGETTKRDRVWDAALQLAENSVEADGVVGQKFRVEDVLDVAGLGDSSMKTVRRTLHVMRRMGWLSQSNSKQQWRAGELFDGGSEDGWRLGEL